MKILIFGLPGSGKTWLAERLQKELGCAWFNADQVRTMSNDWDFSEDGRLRQSNRMKNLADFEHKFDRIVICDFVCPTEQTRKSFDADYTIWMDTVGAGRFADTNKIFEKPNKVDYHISQWFDDTHVQLAEIIKRRIIDV